LVLCVFRGLRATLRGQGPGDKVQGTLSGFVQASTKELAYPMDGWVVGGPPLYKLHTVEQH